MQSPTEKLYDGLQAAYNVFNQHLFNSELPDVLITVKRQSHSIGYYKSGEFHGKGKAPNALPELALNPVYFQRDDKRTLSTLVHEMVHHWQFCYGSPSGRYHNREWADRMESIGLIPSTTGEPGGKRTGSRVSL